MPGEDIKQAFYNKAKYTTNVIPPDMYFDGFMEKVKSDPGFLKQVYSAMEEAKNDGRIKKLAPYERVASVFGAPTQNQVADSGNMVAPQKTFPTPEQINAPVAPGQPLPNVGAPTPGMAEAPQVTPTGLPTMESLGQGGVQPTGGEPVPGTDPLANAPKQQFQWSGQQPAQPVVQPQAGMPQTPEQGMTQQESINPIDYAVSTLGSAESGLISQIGSELKGIAETGYSLDKKIVGVLEGTPFEGGFRAPYSKPEDSWLYKAGQGLQDFTEESLYRNPEYAGGIGDIVGQGLGSVGAIMATGGLNPAGGIMKYGAKAMTNPQLIAYGAKELFKAPMIRGAFAMVGQETDSARQLHRMANQMDKDAYVVERMALGEDKADAGKAWETLRTKTEDEVAESMIMPGIFAGVTEAIPLERLLVRLGKPAQNIVLNAFKQGGIQGAEEASQEVIQQTIINAGIGNTYNEAHRLTTGLMESAEGGGATGFVLGSVLTALVGKRANVKQRVQSGEITPQEAIAEMEDINKAEKLVQDKLQSLDNVVNSKVNEEIKALTESKEAQTFFDSNEPALTNPLVTIPKEVETVLDKISDGILVSPEALHEAYQWTNGSVKATLENQALSDAEKGATLNIFNGILSDIDKANTEGQKFVEEVEAGSVQDRVPAKREADLPKGQRPMETQTPALDQAKQIREDNRKQAGTNIIPSSGETIITPPPTTDVVLETETIGTPERITEPVTSKSEPVTASEIIKSEPVAESATEAITETPTGTETPVAGAEANPALADVESTAKALDGVKINANFNLSLEQSETPKQVSEAYHKAKQDGSNPELVQAVEQALAPVSQTQPQTTPQTQTTETVATTTESTEQKNGQTTQQPQVKITPVNATDVETITKIENAIDKGREIALSKPTNKHLKRAFEAYEDIVDRARKAGIYDGKTLKIGGQEIEVDTPAKFKAFLSNQGNFDAVTEAVKDTESNNPVEAKKEFKEKNQKAREEAKAKAEQAQKVFDETLSGLDDIKSEAKKTSEEFNNGDSNDIILKSGVDIKSLLKVPEMAMKAINFGDDLIAKVTKRIQDAGAKLIRAGMKSRMKAVGQASNISQGSIKNLASTEYESDIRRRFQGGIKSAAVQALEFYNKAIEVVGGDVQSLTRVHQVLDPELYEGKVTTGGMPRVEESDLSIEEKMLLDLLRKNLDFIHEWHYANGFISKETYEKNKGNYSPRFWEMETQEDPEISAMYQQMGKSVNKKYIKERKALDEMMKDADDAIQDPVFGTAMRMAQTLRNKAIVDYANQVLQTDSVHKGSNPPPPGYILLEGTKYGPLNGKFVARDIAEDFKGYFLTNEIANQAYKLGRFIDSMPAVQFIKRSKTVYDAAVFLGNIISNISFAFKVGVDPANFIANIASANKSIDTQDADYKHLLKEGVLGTDIITEDIRTKSESIRIKGRTFTTNTQPSNPLARSSPGVVKRVMEDVEKWYGKTDDIAKLAAYKALRNQGMSVDEATRRVFEGFQNYGVGGRYFDVASKTPGIGNRFVKFKGDMVRMSKNNWTKRPLASIAYFSLLNALGAAVTKYWGKEDEDETKAREAMAFKPKVDFPQIINDLGIPDISLAWQTDIGEVNAARMIGTDYLYDVGEREFGGDLEEFSQKLPYQVKYSEDKDSPIPVSIAFNDAVFGPILQLATNRDFRGKRILDPTATDYRPGRETSLDMAINATKFLLNAWLPYYGKTESMYSSIMGEPDQYGRNRNPIQSLVNNFIKVQTVGKPEILESYKKDLDFMADKIESLDKDFSAVRNKAVKDYEKILSNESTSERYKEREAERIYNQTLQKYAETEDKKAKIYSRMLKKFELIEPILNK